MHHIGRSKSATEQTRPQPSNPFPALTFLIVLFKLDPYSIPAIDSSDSGKESFTHDNHDIMTDSMNQDRDTTMKLHDDESMNNRMTTHATKSETSFIRQSEDKTDVAGLMNNVEIEPGQGFTIKGNIIRQGSISSTHLYPTDITWRDDGGPMPASLDFANEATNQANDQLKLVQSSYNEETWTHSVPLNTEVDGRNGTVAQSIEIIGAFAPK